MRRETTVTLTSERNATLAFKELLLEPHSTNFVLLFYIGNQNSRFMQLKKFFAWNQFLQTAHPPVQAYIVATFVSVIEYSTDSSEENIKRWAVNITYICNLVIAVDVNFQVR